MSPDNKLVQCIQQSLRQAYTETLYKVYMASSTKMGSLNSETVQGKGLSREND